MGLGVNNCDTTFIISLNRFELVQVPNCNILKQKLM